MVNCLQCLVKSVCALGVCLLVLGLPVSPAHAAATPEILINATQYRIRIAMADPLGSASGAPTLQKYIQGNLSFLPFVQQLDQRGILGGTKLPVATGPELDFKRFQLAGADLLITSNWVASDKVELRTFETTSGKFVFGNIYNVGNDAALGDTADKFCAELMESITGRGDFFRATIAFSKSDGKGKKDIWAVRPTGRELRRLTNMPGEAISPTWSHDGRFVVFSHIDIRTHALGVWDSTTRMTNRIKFPGNTVIGPCFMPDNKVAVSLTDGQNPSIFLLNYAFQKEKRLVNSSGIDVSPSVDAAGAKMVFTSSRQGNPQIFMKDLRSGAETRVTSEGNYNTDPSISPDGTLVAYARLTGQGNRIFVRDLLTGQDRQVSFGPGSDEQPAFGPDSYFIAYSSNRGGQRLIYLTTRHGGDPKQIPTGPGDAAFPDWGVFQRK